MAVVEAKALQFFLEQHPYPRLVMLVDEPAGMRPHVLEAGPPTFKSISYICPVLPELSVLTKSPWLHTVVLHPTKPIDFPFSAQSTGPP